MQAPGRVCGARVVVAPAAALCPADEASVVHIDAQVSPDAVDATGRQYPRAATWTLAASQTVAPGELVCFQMDSRLQADWPTFSRSFGDTGSADGPILQHRHATAGVHQVQLAAASTTAARAAPAGIGSHPRWPTHAVVPALRQGSALLGHCRCHAIPAG
jgi:hypothetical protein